MYLSKNTTNLLKFLCAILIMLHHYAQYVCANDLSDNIIYHILSSQCGFIGVIVFFYLSGYGLMESENKKHLDLVQFIKRRLLKIYLPVVVVSVLWLPLYYDMNDVVLDFQKIGTYRDIATDIFLGMGQDNILWFVKILIFLYITFYILTTIKAKTYLSIITSFTLTIGICWFAIEAFGWYAVISIPAFWIGVITSMYNNKAIKKSNIYIYILTFFIIESAILFNVSRSLLIHSTINYAILVCMIIFFSKIKCDIPNTKIIGILGIISYDIYLVHGKVLMYMTQACQTVVLHEFIMISLLLSVSLYIIRTKLLNI